MKLEVNKQNRPNAILALSIISESEISMLFPDYSADWPDERLNKALHFMGMDSEQGYEIQDGLWHRNRLNKVVLCRRFVGNERMDTDWIKSGHASSAAKDKHSGSRILEDLYRAKNLTEDTQDRLESRDRYSVIDEDVQE